MNNYALPLDKKNLAVIRTIFPATDSSRISFSGSRLAAFALRLLKYGSAQLARFGRVGTLGFALFAGAAIPLALVANRFGAAAILRRPPDRCTGMTVIMDID